MKRRDFIAISATAAVWLLTGCGGGSDGGGGNPGGENPGGGNPPGAGNPGGGSPGNPNPAPGELAIPPLLDPAPVGGVKQFTLSIQEGSKEFFPGTATRTYGISADYLGPTLLLRRGEQVSISYTNNLPVVTTMHGHGMHVPAVMDGGPHQIIAPGSTWSANYTVDQKACTNWYHPHKVGTTAEQVYMGLAGMIIIEDDESRALDLPRRYAIDDIPLVVQDKVFDANKQIDYSPSRMQIRQGYLGDTFLVNGVVQPYFNAEAKALRLRILNGSNARVYRFGFSDGRVFSQIATDNSFLPAPVPLSEVRLSPGERAEVVVDLSSDFGGTVVFKDLSSGANLLTINVNMEASGGGGIPGTLTNTLEIPSLANVVRTRSFALGMHRMQFTINGKSMDMNRIDETVPLGDLELWEVTNTMGMNHNFHIHATHFYVVERDGSAANVPANEKAYKDVVFLPPNSSVKFLVKMIDFSDGTNPYMFHCHFLEHEDDGMMGQFVVV
jgi:FtsP/CotA-like multicopper oxidase with cupredoxin domain